MKLDQVEKILEAKVCTSFPYSEIEVSAACGADLMSDVLAFGEDKGLLLTGLNNPQCVRTAEMMDISCVVLVRGKDPDESLISLANEKNVVVMKTDHLMFNSCGLLYDAGIRGGA